MGEERLLLEFIKTDEWIQKLWYIYTMEYHSAIRKTAFMSVRMRWMYLEFIIQSEVSQKDKYCILTHAYGIFKEIQPVHLKGDQSWVFIGRTDAEAETPILWPPHATS